MGLTAAEAFMLICFILLLLLGLWQQTSEERLEKAREAEDFYNGFTSEERIAAMTYQPRLAELGSDLAELEDLSLLTKEANGQKQLEDAIRLYRQVDGIPPDDVAERARLLDDATLKQLAEAAAVLPLDTKRKLVDMAALENFPEIVAAMHAAPEDVLEATTLREETEVQRKALHAREEELAEYRATGLSPEQIDRMRSTVSDLNRISANALETRADIAAAIREQAGDVITEMGGKILANGNVTFPEGVLFDSGSADLKPEFDAVLSRFCGPWFRILQGFDASLNNIQIEGHASSEWAKESSPPAAFANNLDLSQQRAANVFKKCLGYAGDDATSQWARGRLVAIGYSSSRPVLNREGTEDKSASRRVVFAIDTKTSQDALSEPTDAGFPDTPVLPEDTSDFRAPVPDARLETLPDERSYRDLGYQPLSGRVLRVVDGDTIVVGTTKIRLEGLHAPEQWESIGSDAKTEMMRISLERDASCWLSGETTYDRSVGVCFVAEQDIAGLLIASGLGRDCPGYSERRYAAVEAAAPGRVTGPLPNYCLQ